MVDQEKFMLVVAHCLDEPAVAALQQLPPCPRIKVRVEVCGEPPIMQERLEQSVVLWSTAMSMRGSCLRVPQVLPDSHNLLPDWVLACAGVILLNPQAPSDKLPLALGEALRITWPSVLRGRILRAGAASGGVRLGSC